MTTQNQPTNETQSRWVFDPYHTQVEFCSQAPGYDDGAWKLSRNRRGWLYRP